MPRLREVVLDGRTVAITENDDGTFSLPADLEALRGWAGALKPAVEPIILARKPLIGTVAANVLAHRTGALNIDATRIETGGEQYNGGPGSGTNTVYGDYTGGAYELGTGRLPPNPNGRWPSNLVLVHVERAYYHLRDDLDPAVIESVHDYFRSLQAVSEVRWPDHRDAVHGGEAEVLLAGVPCGAAERGTPGEPDDGVGDVGVPAVRHDVRGDAGVGAERSPEVLLEPVSSPGRGAAETPVGEAPHRRGASEDGAGRDRATGQGTVVAVEGRHLPRPGGLPVGDDRPPAGDDTGARASDGPARQAVRDGTPGGHGSDAGASADPLGDRAPSQRGEGRQPAGEPHAARPVPPQHGTPRSRETARGVGSGERRTEGTLVVAEHLIPPGWRSYFHRRFTEGCRPTGATRDVKSATHYPSARGKGGIGNDGHAGQDDLDEVSVRSEAVEEWVCAPGCPIAALDEQSGDRPGFSGGGTNGAGFREQYVGGSDSGWRKDDPTYYADNGGASRFFARFAEAVDEQIETDGPVRYVAKAPGKERPSYERLDPPTTMLRLRADLTDEQRAHVLERLREAGVDVR